MQFAVVSTSVSARGIRGRCLSSRSVACGVLSLVLLTGEAKAELAVAPALARTSPARAPGLDFDFFGDQGTSSAKTDEEEAAFASRVHRRRWMLKTHQVLGFTTWALMVATVTVGQLNYNQLYGGGGGSVKYQTWHRDLVLATSSAFAAAATFAIFAPTPYAKPLRFDTGLIHRLAVIGATAGMVTEAILGFSTNRQANTGNQHYLSEMARTHQIVGYTTLGFLTIAGAVWVF